MPIDDLPPDWRALHMSPDDELDEFRRDRAMVTRPQIFEGTRVPALKEGEIIRPARPEELSRIHTNRSASNRRVLQEKRRTGANPKVATLFAVFGRLLRQLRATSTHKEGS